jgi:cytochrome oxidase Cu insertion factor (SCO1/SenC/PrrC family)
MPSKSATAILDAGMIHPIGTPFRVKFMIGPLLLALICAAVHCKKSRYADSPQIAVPEFEVYRPSGSIPLSREIPAKGVAVLFFGYRGCPDICSGALRRIGQAHEMLSGEYRLRTRTIFVEVGQTPLEEAGIYARGFDASMGVAVDQGRRITQALGIYVHPVGNSQPVRIEHSGTIILADHKMIGRKRLPHDITARDLAYEIEVILGENQD